MNSPEIADIADLARSLGGALIGAYREPLGARPLVLAALPLSTVQPTNRNASLRHDSVSNAELAWVAVGAGAQE